MNILKSIKETQLHEGLSYVQQSVERADSHRCDRAIRHGDHITDAVIAEARLDMKKRNLLFPFNELREFFLAAVEHQLEEKSLLLNDMKGELGGYYEVYQDEDDRTIAVMKKELELIRLNNFNDKNIITPNEFRESCENLSLHLLQYGKEIEGLDPDNTIVALPWRAALSFAVPALKIGVRPENFYHMGVFRVEEDLTNGEYYRNIPSRLSLTDPSKNRNLKVKICDPMLVTSGTIRNEIQVLVNLGVRPENISIYAYLGAPEGIDMLLEAFPGVTIYIMKQDSHLNNFGFIVGGMKIVPGMTEHFDNLEWKRLAEDNTGDVGDQFMEKLDNEAFSGGLVSVGIFNEQDQQAFIARQEHLAKEEQEA